MSIIHDMANIEPSMHSSIDVTNPAQVIIRNTQDCEPILVDNKRLYNQALEDGGYGPTREWKRAASIPFILLEKWYQKEGIRWWDRAHLHRITAKLDDPDWKGLRTAPGHLGERVHRTYYRASTGSV